MTTAGRALRNIGIVAHVDAGKTTTTEQMLFISGTIRALGRVDAGTAHTDWLDVERERGISVRAATTVLTWQECAINLIDTPGHVDFSSEVERVLRVLDGAILMISAVEGVQAHTETLWRALVDLRIPTVFFMNKLDRVGADPVRVLEDIRRTLTAQALPLQVACGVESDFTGVLPLLGVKAGERTQESFLTAYEDVLTRAAQEDDHLLMRYVQGESIADQDIEDALRTQVRQFLLHPVLYGSAIKGVGITELLDTVVRYLPPPVGESSLPLSGVVFKVERHHTMGRVAYVRLYNGVLQNRDAVRNDTQGKVEKVTQIRKMRAQHYEDVGVIEAGDIAAVCGLSQARVGDVLGDASAVPTAFRLSTPLLTVQVHHEDVAAYPRLVAALQELDDEDPTLSLQWLQDERELHIKVMGVIQLEVLMSQLLSRFGLTVRFDPPAVIYKETPIMAAEGFVAYTMPKPCWAILRFLIEPIERGKGLIYSSRVRPDQLLSAYQHVVERRVPEALQQGLRGFEVTDVRVTLIEGEHHVWHTHPLDFVVATPMGVMAGLNNTGTKLLEPILRFHIIVPEEVGGRVLSDLMQMRAIFDNPSMLQGRFSVEGEVPLATSMDYSVQLGSLSGGRGVFSTRFVGYREAPPDVTAARPRRGVNPLDTAKYILSVRHALAGTNLD